jgi:hypothetical protein
MIVNAITGLAIALDCNAYLSKKQHLMIAFGKLFPHGFKQIITTNQKDELWAYTTTIKAHAGPRRCRSNRNGNSAGDVRSLGRCPHRNPTSPDR